MVHNMSSPSSVTICHKDQDRLSVNCYYLACVFPGCSYLQSLTEWWKQLTDPREISATKNAVIQITEFLHLNMTAKVSINCPWGNAYQSYIKLYRAHSFLSHGIQIGFVDMYH